MLRIIIAAVVCSGALALNKDSKSLRSQVLASPDADEIKKELDELKDKIESKEDKKTKAEELQKRIDDLAAAEEKEDEKDEARREKMNKKLKCLRQELKDIDKHGEIKDSSMEECEEIFGDERKKEVPVKAEAEKEADAADAIATPKVEVPEVKVPEGEVPEVKVPEVSAPGGAGVADVKVEVPEVFPVPTTSRCIVIMCCQYMVVYFALAVCRTYLELTGTAKGKVEAGLRAAAQTLTYGPMLCVLFIACRMRVEFLSDGKDQPQAWVQNCMYALTFAVLASTVLVLVMPLVTGKPLALKEGTCDLEKPELSESDSKLAFYALTIARYLILLGLYGGLAGVIVGICTYLPPGATDLSTLPAPAPAVMCTMILATAFFATQLVIAVCRSYTEFKGVEFPKVVGMMNAAANTMEFAPMLSILFLAARMRALQHDGQPQAWAQNCMYASTAALCATTILAIIVPLVMGGSMTTNPTTKEHTFEVPSPMFGYAIMCIRFLCMLGFYGGSAGVMFSIFTFESPKGPEHTLPVSPAVHCVVNLTCQFFFVYLLQTIMLTVSEVSGGRIPLEKLKLFAAVEASKATLAFAPMLSILFVTTRMYALLITDKKGAPPAWVQDGMYMATWSLLISFVACLATGLIVNKVETDEDGNVVNKFSNKYVAWSMLAVRYLAMTLLYGGILMVIVGLFVMTPETANGRGSVPIVSDVADATPIGNAPPSPTDVADAGKNAGEEIDGAVSSLVEGSKMSGLW